MKETTERDYDKLRGRVVEMYRTQKGFAEALGKDLSLVNLTLNGKRNIDQEEIEQWCRVLKIPTEEIPTYFFGKKVANMQPETT